MFDSNDMVISNKSPANTNEMFFFLKNRLGSKYFKLKKIIVDKESRDVAILAMKNEGLSYPLVRKKVTKLQLPHHNSM